MSIHFKEHPDAAALYCVRGIHFDHDGNVIAMHGMFVETTTYGCRVTNRPASSFLPGESLLREDVPEALRLGPERPLVERIMFTREGA